VRFGFHTSEGSDIHFRTKRSLEIIRQVEKFGSVKASFRRFIGLRFPQPYYVGVAFVFLIAGGSAEVSAQISPPANSITLSFEDALKRARSINPELSAAIVDQQVAHEDRVQARAALLPSASMNTRSTSIPKGMAQRQTPQCSSPTTRFTNTSLNPMFMRISGLVKLPESDARDGQKLFQRQRWK